VPGAAVTYLTVSRAAGIYIDYCCSFFRMMNRGCIINSEFSFCLNEGRPCAILPNILKFRIFQH